MGAGKPHLPGKLAFQMCGPQPKVSLFVVELLNAGSFDCLDFCQLALGTHLTCTYLPHHELESVLTIITVIVYTIMLMACMAYTGILRTWICIV